MDGRTEGRREGGKRRRLESCELVTFVIEFSHPAFSMLPPSLLSLLCFCSFSLVSPLLVSSLSLSLLSSLSFVRPLARSFIAAVSRDFSSFCLTDRTPEPPSPRSVRPRRTSSAPLEVLLVSQVISSRQKSVKKMRRRRENRASALECFQVLWRCDTIHWSFAKISLCKLYKICDYRDRSM